MAEIRGIINGMEICVPAGTTILDAANQAGIDIPTLCHHKKLKPIGACRVCVVEIKGQRNLQTACTFPMTDGMEIETESLRVVDARRFILGMLFSERNHLCPFCEASGDCELQNLGYRYGIDHWFYPTFTQGYPQDASRGYFTMNQNRCILCQRCSRACSELVANHTLGLRERGTDTRIHCDADIPCGISSCIECGTCLQICPTGALYNQRTAFMGKGFQTETTKSVCNRCSVGCGTSIVTRAGNVLSINGDWDAPVNDGLLCRMGRFDPLYDQRRRLTEPMLRLRGKLEPVGWDEALQAVADRFSHAEADSIGMLASSDATNEAFYLANLLFKKELKTENVGLFSEAAPALFDKPPGGFSELKGSDAILLVGANPAKDQPVSSYFIKRLVDNGVKLIVVDDEKNELSPFASLTFKMEDLARAVEIAHMAGNVTVLYGSGVSEQSAPILKKLESKARFVAIEPGVNTRSAVKFGFNNGFQAAAAKVVFVLLGEQDPNANDILENIGKDAFIVVQAGYVSSLLDRADAVFPSAIGMERSGTLMNTEGRIQLAAKAVEPPGKAKADWEILSLLAKTLGKNIGSSFADISSLAVRALK